MLSLWAHIRPVSVERLADRRSRVIERIFPRYSEDALIKAPFRSQRWSRSKGFPNLPPASNCLIDARIPRMRASAISGGRLRCIASRRSAGVLRTASRGRELAMLAADGDADTTTGSGKRGGPSA